MFRFIVLVPRKPARPVPGKANPRTISRKANPRTIPRKQKTGPVNSIIYGIKGVVQVVFTCHY